MLLLCTHLHTLLTTALSRPGTARHPSPGRRRGEAGQSTVEYALVILAAAGLALLVVAWAAGTGRIGQLFDRVVDSVTAEVG